MFRRGAFSSDGLQQITDSVGLKRITDEDIIKAFQVTHENPLVGVEGRRRMLNRLGAALEAHPEIFGAADGSGITRPGYLLDYLLFQVTDSHRRLASVRVLWKAVVDGLGDVFPGAECCLSLFSLFFSHCSLPLIDPSGVHLGDTWTHSALGGPDVNQVPFHKLAQWCTYSLLEVLQQFGIKVCVSSLMYFPLLCSHNLLSSLSLLVRFFLLVLRAVLVVLILTVHVLQICGC